MTHFVIVDQFDIQQLAENGSVQAEIEELDATIIVCTKETYRAQYEGRIVDELPIEDDPSDQTCKYCVDGECARYGRIECPYQQLEYNSIGSIDPLARPQVNTVKCTQHYGE